jgi:hypothetical protein
VALSCGVRWLGGDRCLDRGAPSQLVFLTRSGLRVTQAARDGSGSRRSPG